MLVYFLELLTKTKTTKKLGAQGLVINMPDPSSLGFYIYKC